MIPLAWTYPSMVIDGIGLYLTMEPAPIEAGVPNLYGTVQGKRCVVFLSALMVSESK